VSVLSPKRRDGLETEQNQNHERRNMSAVPIHRLKSKQSLLDGSILTFLCCQKHLLLQQLVLMDHHNAAYQAKFWFQKLEYNTYFFGLSLLMFRQFYP